MTEVFITGRVGLHNGKIMLFNIRAFSSLKALKESKPGWNDIKGPEKSWAFFFHTMVEVGDEE